MAVSNVTSDTGALSLVDLLYEAKMKSSIFDSSQTMVSSNEMLSSLQAKKAQESYGSGASSAAGQAALRRALSEMGNTGEKVTFKQIAEYRETLETKFSAQVRVDLAELGVSIDTPFSLNMTPDGKIEVLCDDALAKEKIEKYLADNPEVGEQFSYIQALANLERARQSPAASKTAWQDARNATKEMQASAIEMFFGDAMKSGMDYSSLLANFGAGEDATANFFAGLNFKI